MFSVWFLSEEWDGCVRGLIPWSLNHSWNWRNGLRQVFFFFPFCRWAVQFSKPGWNGRLFKPLFILIITEVFVKKSLNDTERTFLDRWQEIKLPSVLIIDFQTDCIVLYGNLRLTGRRWNSLHNYKTITKQEQLRFLLIIRPHPDTDLSEVFNRTNLLKKIIENTASDLLMYEELKPLAVIQWL